MRRDYGRKGKGGKAARRKREKATGGKAKAGKPPVENEKKLRAER